MPKICSIYYTASEWNEGNFGMLMADFEVGPMLALITTLTKSSGKVKQWRHFSNHYRHR